MSPHTQLSRQCGDDLDFNSPGLAGHFVEEASAPYYQMEGELVEEEELLGEIGELPLMLRAMVAIGERPGHPHRFGSKMGVAGGGRFVGPVRPMSGSLSRRIGGPDIDRHVTELTSIPTEQAVPRRDSGISTASSLFGPRSSDVSRKSSQTSMGSSGLRPGATAAPLTQASPSGFYDPISPGSSRRSSQLSAAYAPAPPSHLSAATILAQSLQELVNGAEGTLLTADQIKEEARRLSGQSNISNEEDTKGHFDPLPDLSQLPLDSENGGCSAKGAATKSNTVVTTAQIHHPNQEVQLEEVAEGEMVENKLVIPDEMMQYLNQSILGIDAPEPSPSDDAATKKPEKDAKNKVKDNPAPTKTSAIKEKDCKKEECEVETQNQDKNDTTEEKTVENDDKLAIVAKETKTDGKDEDSDKNKEREKKNKDSKKDDALFKEPLPSVPKDSKPSNEVKVKDVLAMSIGTDKSSEETAMSIGDSGPNPLEKLKNVETKANNETYQLVQQNNMQKCQSSQNLMTSQGRLMQMGLPNCHNYRPNVPSQNIQAMQNMIAGQNLQMQHPMMQHQMAMMNSHQAMINRQNMLMNQQKVMNPYQNMMMNQNQQNAMMMNQNMMNSQMNMNVMSPQMNNMNVMSPQNNMNMNVMSPQSNINMNVMSPQNNMNVMSPQNNMNINAMSPQSMNVMSPQNNINMNVMSPQNNVNMNVMSPQNNVNMNVMSPQSNMNVNVMSPQANMNVMSPQIPRNVMSPHMNMNVMSPPTNLMSPPSAPSDMRLLAAKKLPNQTNAKQQQYLHPNQMTQNCNVPYPNGPMSSQLAMHNRLMQYQMQTSTNALPKSAASSMSIDQSIGSNANMRSNHHESMHQYSNMTLCERHYQDCRGAQEQGQTCNSQTFVSNQHPRAQYNPQTPQNAKTQQQTNCDKTQPNYNQNFCGNQWDYQRQNVYQNYNNYEVVYQNQQRFANDENGATRIPCHGESACPGDGNLTNADEVQVWDISQSQGSPARNGARQEAYRRTLAYVQSCQGWTNPETVSSSTHPLCKDNSNMVVNDLNTSLSSLFEENQFLQMIQ